MYTKITGEFKKRNTEISSHSWVSFVRKTWKYNFHLQFHMYIFDIAVTLKLGLYQPNYNERVKLNTGYYCISVSSLRMWEKQNN